jgi:DNA-binding LacI/PurR family transcriptional regulator
MLEADAASMRSSVDLLLGQNVEAIVLIAAHRGALEAIQGIDLGVPLVAVESSGRVGFHSVSIDQYRGAFEATSHLISLGHTAIAHIAGPADSMDATERIRGWRAALSEHRLVARTPLVGDWTPGSGFAIGTQLAAERGFTAVFSANDQMALGAMHAFAASGISIPGDVSVVGFDDIPEAEHFTPPLTTVRQDFAALGRAVMATLLELINDETDDTVERPDPVLVVRASTAPPLV